MTRELKYNQAILEATDQCLAADPRVYLIGLGVPDPKGVFGTTIGLEKKYGSKRVMDMPCSENGMTGIVIGSSLVGMKPIMTHQRVDFFLLALDQLINNASKWHYMFGKKMSVPIVIRLVIGRGWGQGPQHSQSLQSIFAHIPGLKVVMPSTPYDAKGLLISAVRDPNPVIYMEHRWLHEITGMVPEEMYEVEIGKAKIVREGNDVTIVSTSLMTLEALRAAQWLSGEKISAEVIDVRTLKPLDKESILASVQKTGRLIVADAAWKTLGFGAEVIAIVAEEALSSLKSPPQRICLPDLPTPTSWSLAEHYYPRATHIVNAVLSLFGRSPKSEKEVGLHHPGPFDVPDKSFTGPF